VTQTEKLRIAEKPKMLVFFTVGSTRFDALVQAALSKDVLTCLYRKGYTKAVIQCGNSEFEFFNSVAGKDGVVSVEREGVAVEIFKFKAGLHEEYIRADLVVSHAGMLYI
jgi:beta-1,4-N-acetylglucosaminyltransferase